MGHVVGFCASVFGVIRIRKRGSVSGGRPARLVIDCTNSLQYGHTLSIPFVFAKALICFGENFDSAGKEYVVFKVSETANGLGSEL